MEHNVRDEGVAGSNPATPTNTYIVRPGDMGDGTYLRHG